MLPCVCASVSDVPGTNYTATYPSVLPLPAVFLSSDCLPLTPYPFITAAPVASVLLSALNVQTLPCPPPLQLLLPFPPELIAFTFQTAPTSKPLNTEATSAFCCQG